MSPERLTRLLTTYLLAATALWWFLPTKNKWGCTR